MNYELSIFSCNKPNHFIDCRKMQPVHNREFLLEYMNNHNRINSSNILNNYIDYSILINTIVLNTSEREHIDLINNIYMNHLNNNYIYNYGYQAAAAAHPTEAVSASSTFERLNIDVEHHVVAPPSQVSSSQHCDGDDDACCSICLNSEEKKEEKKEMVKTKCAHIFHSKCLAKWVIQKTTCPMCRNSLLTKKIT